MTASSICLPCHICCGKKHVSVSNRDGNQNKATTSSHGRDLVIKSAQDHVAAAGVQVDNVFLQLQHSHHSSNHQAIAGLLPPHRLAPMCKRTDRSILAAQAPNAAATAAVGSLPWNRACPPHRADTSSSGTTFLPSDTNSPMHGSPASVMSPGTSPMASISGHPHMGSGASGGHLNLLQHAAQLAEGQASLRGTQQWAQQQMLQQRQAARQLLGEVPLPAQALYRTQSLTKVHAETGVPWVQPEAHQLVPVIMLPQRHGSLDMAPIYRDSSLGGGFEHSFATNIASRLGVSETAALGEDAHSSFPGDIGAQHTSTAWHPGHLMAFEEAGQDKVSSRKLSVAQAALKAEEQDAGQFWVTHRGDSMTALDDFTFDNVLAYTPENNKGLRRPPSRVVSMPALSSIKATSRPPKKVALLSSAITSGPCLTGYASPSAPAKQPLVQSQPSNTTFARTLSPTSRSRFAVELDSDRHRPSYSTASNLLAPGFSRLPPSSTAAQLLLSPAPSAQTSFMSVGSGCVAAGSTLARLHRIVERLMMTDADIYRRVQVSSAGITNLAKETTALQFSRDTTGATCINQYVVIKTLGRGTFGKVKLCLNTLDSRMYAVKMINRTFLLKQLQRPVRSLRRRINRESSDIVSKANSVLSGVLEMGAPSLNAELSSSQSPQQARLGGGTPPRCSIDYATNSSGASLPSRSSLDDFNPLHSIMREIAVMKKVDHPAVVKLHEVIDPPGSAYLMLVLEYCEKGPVMATRGQSGFASLNEQQAWEVMRQVCSGLDYLHYNNIVHGDLKPENLLVCASGQVKIADFGSSRIVSNCFSSTRYSCTPAFQAPEQLCSTYAQPASPFAGDVWALGCVLYCLVFGRLPFQGSCVMDVSHAIVTAPMKLPMDVPISEELQDLLMHILEKDPAKRLTLQEVMEHAWVSNYTMSPLVSLCQLSAPPRMIEVSYQDCSSAIDRASLVSLLRARLKEKIVKAGECLYVEGEEAHCIYMIMAGVVELITDLVSAVAHPLSVSRSSNKPLAPSRSEAGDVAVPDATAVSSSTVAPATTSSLSEPAAASTQAISASLSPLADTAQSVLSPGCHPLSSGLNQHLSTDEVSWSNAQRSYTADWEVVAHRSSANSFSVDVDDSLTLDCDDLSAALAASCADADGKLHIDRAKAHELKKRMMDAAMRTCHEYVLDVKGPGQVLGVLAMEPGRTPVHPHTARAREDVVVVKLTEEAFIQAMLQVCGPEAAVAAAAPAYATATGGRELMMLQGLETLESGLNVIDSTTGCSSAWGLAIASGSMMYNHGAFSSHQQDDPNMGCL